MMFEDSLIHTVKRALLDPLSEVREAAAEAFNRLHDTIGQKALDGILPHVLEKLVSCHLLKVLCCVQSDLHQRIHVYSGQIIEY